MSPPPRLRVVGAGRAGTALATALGRDFKGKASLVLYIAAIPLAFVSPWLAAALYVAVAMMWLVPDRRIERTMDDTTMFPDKAR